MVVGMWHVRLLWRRRPRVVGAQPPEAGNQLVLHIWRSGRL